MKRFQGLNALSVIVLALGLAGCATKAQDPMQQAVMTPFSDLNLVRAEIPPALLAARAQPYALDAAGSCAQWQAEIAALDAVLGADLDQPVNKDKPSLLERGNEAVDEAAGKALRGAAEGVIPFRGWVRRLSGAERYERGVAAAITAGSVRRAYLKGVVAGRACAAAEAARAPA
ncbi:hypothetical protein HNQ51_001212 [Inhella inkyongensis]|uniref:Lipoprotein n=1 Tax=Inhella inkyongensis TaxID=392593 RepID=A0A840S605_9BURK|nr:hypothetical protein [Inhella inkyongensis]MBB5203919.1 hypothetical protein [Inhella inkyongensis]